MLVGLGMLVAGILLPVLASLFYQWIGKIFQTPIRDTLAG